MNVATPGVEGPSFPLSVKFLASVLVASLLVWTVRVADDLAALPDRGALWFLAAALVFVVGSWWAILRGRTSIDATHIRQRWLWSKEVALADIAQLKLIELRGLHWLVAPRLVVRARGPLLATFHAADPQVLAAFRRLAHGDAAA
jgi:hypothetical protein